MWGLILSLVLPAQAAECRFNPGAQTQRIEVVAPARGVVILELRLLGQAAAPTALLKVLSDRKVPATVLPSAAWAERNGASLKGIAKDGHEVGYWMSLREDLNLSGDIAVAPDLSHWVSALRTAKARVEKSTGADIQTIAVQRLPKVGEVAMEGLGFRTILPSERTLGDVPRKTKSLHSSAGRARIIGEGAYDDGCGATLPSWTPAALDRATRTAARAEWVRVALPSNPSAAPLLAQWLDQVVLPQGWTVLTAAQAGKRAKPGLGAPQAKPDASPALGTTRQVATPIWTEVAQVLANTHRLPRALPGRLTPTESFLGLTQLVANDHKPQQIGLGALKPPAEIARSSLVGTDLTLTEAAVRTTARDILPGLTGQVPGFVSVGPHSLTAAEFLRVMALVYLGHPPIARRVTDPDPFAPGGGWGQSEGL